MRSRYVNWMELFFFSPDLKHFLFEIARKFVSENRKWLIALWSGKKTTLNRAKPPHVQCLSRLHTMNTCIYIHICIRAYSYICKLNSSSFILSWNVLILTKMKTNTHKHYFNCKQYWNLCSMKNSSINLIRKIDMKSNI